MIDLCVYALLDEDQDLKAAITTFCNTSPTLSINHTNFLPAQFPPSTIEIGTKKPGERGDMARQQIGVWHATQWAFLQWAVGQAPMLDST